MKKEEKNAKVNDDSEFEQNKDFELEESEVKTKKSYVSSSMGMLKQRMSLIFIILFALGAIYFIFNDDSSKHHDASTGEKLDTKSQTLSKEKLDDLSAKSRPVIKDNAIEEVQIPQRLPELPKLPEPILPPPVVNSDVVASKLVMPEFQPDMQSIPREAPKQAFSTKPDLATPMLVISGGAGGNSAASDHVSDAAAGLNPQDFLDPKKFEDFKKSLQEKSVVVDENSEIQRTGGQVIATHRGNLDYLIGIGKIIDVVLENGINTELQGMLRGIVSRDIYSESGNMILIPKGSRLIGTYSTNITPSQARVEVTWSTIRIPNGIDVQVASLGTDELGRSGVYGTVDPKFKGLFLSSALVSAIQFGSGQLAGIISGNDPITTTTVNPANGSGGASTTTTATPSAVAALNAVNNFAQSMTDFVGKYKNVNPVIKVPQGERVKVFVQHDLVFPKSAFGPNTIK